MNKMQRHSYRLIKQNDKFFKRFPREFSDDHQKSATQKKLKAFNTIPGPCRLPIIGNLHLFSRFGPYTFDKLYDAYEDLYRKHGPVVRLELGISILALFNPEDIQRVLDLSDHYPDRPLIEALKHYRLKNKDKYRSGGLVSENGHEWKRLRDAVNFMMSPKFVEPYLSAHEEIADDFVKRISLIRDSQNQVKDFLQELYRYTEESIGLVCFGLRLGLMDESKSETKWCAKITENSIKTLQAFQDTLIGFPWWKIYKTKAYKKLAESQDFFHSFSLECIEKAKAKLKDPSNLNDVTLQFYRKLADNSGIDSKDISLLMTEIFSSGIDSTGNQIGYTLYHLARNPDVQETLYKEIETHTPPGERLTKYTIDKMQYLRACIKESYRLTSTSGGTARILKSPTEISGYLVPAKVVCIGLHPVIGRQPEYFSDPLHFKPERWMDADAVRPHPFTVLPFSHGVRRCVGQRFAEQEIKLCLIKILKKYKVKYEGPPVGSKMRLLLVPDKPLDFVFEDRSKIQ